MFDSEKNLKGLRIASFRMPLAPWHVAAKAFGIACLLYWLVRVGYSHDQSGLLVRFMSSADGFGLLPCIGIIAFFSGNRSIQFHENGVSIPKAAGQVFLSREQILDMKLDGDRFIVTGPDAAWKGPYSGGIFRIRGQDLRKFQDVLAQFARP